MNKRLQAPTKEELQELYSNSSCSISELARKYSTSNPTVRKWLINYEIPLKSHTQVCQSINKLRTKNIPERETLEHYYNTHSIYDTYKFFGVGQQTLYDWLSIYNIPIRTLSESCLLGKERQFEELRNISVDEVVLAYKTYKNDGISAEKLGISPSYFKTLRYKYDIETNFSRSIGEQNLLEYCGESFVGNNRSVINPFELDIVSKEHKLAIEYCGLYWHSESMKEDNCYHRNKYNLCKEKGYSLLTIFDSDDLTKVKRLIDSKLGRLESDYARKCIIKELSPKLANEFHKKYHIHNSSGGSIHLGLYLNSELVMVASFCKSRFNKKYEYECSRLTSGDIRIIGGASKLFKHFLSKKSSLITYSDLRFGNGSVYSDHCGLKYLGDTNPNYWYFNNGQLHSRVAFQKHKLQSKLEKFDPNLSEYRNMKLNGWDRIWDCGNAIYVSE